MNSIRFKVLSELVDDIPIIKIIKHNNKIDTAIIDSSYEDNKNFKFLSFMKSIQQFREEEKMPSITKTKYYLKNKKYNHRKLI